MQSEHDQDAPKVIKTVVSLTPGLIVRLDKQARRRIVRRSYLIRQAIEAYLTHLEAETVNN